NEINEQIKIFINSTSLRRSPSNSFNSDGQSPVTQNPSRYVVWFNNALDEGHINRFEYSDFRNIQEIGKGGFGIVHSADYLGTKLALKSFLRGKAMITKDFINELKQIRAVDFHPNIIKFFGISFGTGTYISFYNYLSCI
ncbi:46020_t:CDS:2, partial [Gigaspora margarita]